MLDQSNVAPIIKQAPKDPAAAIPGMPPNFGQMAIPQVLTIQGLSSSISRTYRASDEALRNSWENAKFMRNDTGIMECIEGRQRAVSLLDWHLVPEDDSSPLQKQLCADLTAVIERIPRFMQYRECLLHGLWYGNYANQCRVQWINIGGKMRCTPTAWLPVHGDKLVFSIDNPDIVGVRMGYGSGAGATYAEMKSAYPLVDLSTIRGAGYDNTVPTERGQAYMLPPWRRKLFCIHKHQIEDGAYDDPLEAGKVNGVGIRSKIYWDWFQKQELLAFMMEYLERSAFGLELWYYPWGNPEAEAKTRTAAQERIGNGRNIILVPKPQGEDSAAYGVDHIEPGMQGVDAIRDVIDRYFGHRIKRYILGQTLTTESEGGGLGSDGIANVHLNTFMDIVKYDATNLEETLTTDLVAMLKLFNFPSAQNVHIRLKIKTESPDVERKLKAAREVWEMGARVREEDVLEMAGMAIPNAGEICLPGPNGAVAGQQPGGAPTTQNMASQFMEAAKRRGLVQEAPVAI